MSEVVAFPTPQEEVREFDLVISMDPESPILVKDLEGSVVFSGTMVEVLEFLKAKERLQDA